MTRFEKDIRPWYFLIYMDDTGVVWVWWMKSTTATGWLHVSSSVLELHTQGCHGLELMCGTTTRMDENRIMEILGTSNDTRLEGVMDTYLGYCTWNALGLDVNLALIDQALVSLSDLVGYLIIDDGWQNQQDGALTSFSADRVRFPLGLAGSLRYLKQQHPFLHSIGVWHVRKKWDRVGGGVSLTFAYLGTVGFVVWYRSVVVGQIVHAIRGAFGQQQETGRACQTPGSIL